MQNFNVICVYLFHFAPCSYLGTHVKISSRIVPRRPLGVGNIQFQELELEAASDEKGLRRKIR
jgi:hypothetical protein